MIVLRPQDPPPTPSVPVLSLSALVSHPSSFPNAAMLTTLDTQQALLFPHLPWAPFLNRMSHCCLKFNLDKAVVLHFNSSPSCTLLCEITVSFMNVWVLHNAACTVGKQILTVYLNDNCTRKDCQHCVRFGCVCTRLDLSVLCVRVCVCFIVCVNMWRKSVLGDFSYFALCCEIFQLAIL